MPDRMTIPRHRLIDLGRADRNIFLAAHKEQHFREDASSDVQQKKVFSRRGFAEV
jgi:hypothetical protein